MKKAVMLGRKIRGKSWRTGNMNAARFGPYRDYWLLDMRTRTGKRLAYIAAMIISDEGTPFDEMPIFRQALVKSGANIISRLELMQADIADRQQRHKPIPKGLQHDHDNLVQLLLKVGDKLDAWQRKPKDVPSLQEYLKQRALESQRDCDPQTECDVNPQEPES